MEDLCVHGLWHALGAQPGALPGHGPRPAGHPRGPYRFFSILEAGKRIPLHKGPYNGVLRLHLGLRVPEPREQCWIEVDGQRYAWREGEAVIFDDLYPHQVHNDTEGLRAVLFVDFERPCRAPVRWLNRLVLAAAPMSDEIRRGKANHDAWEKAYYGKNRAG